MKFSTFNLFTYLNMFIRYIYMFISLCMFICKERGFLVREGVSVSLDGFISIKLIIILIIAAVL